MYGHLRGDLYLFHSFFGGGMGNKTEWESNLIPFALHSLLHRIVCTLSCCKKVHPQSLRQIQIFTS